MIAGEADRRERLIAAVPVAAIHVGLGLLLLNSFDLTLPPIVRDTLEVVNLAPDPPPPPPPVPPPPPPQAIRPDPDPRRVADPRPEGAASPPNIRSTPTPIVAPEPIVPLPVPTPIRAAPVPGTGFDRSAGAAPVPGPGTGAGGIGNGRGSGAGGDGTGGGGGGGRGGFTRPRHIAGALTSADFRALGEAGIAGTVGVLYVVQPDGRVTDCEAEESSGHAQLDELTCRLIEQRFRFEPSRDASGRPVRSRLFENHTWEIQHMPGERRIERQRRRSLF